ncbi:hypothetical protein HCG48_16850 [Oxynema aestuarii AP17]|uniref:Uncharacterized protein n=1 Tax=Oxynema aestuarii AP17 TaxID=2064643 RepID=A0A6H1TRE6_9CYAN|nr:hypothetical protein [Oxynema aestuarii]QIZ69164.1 hypothetical protein HCG48_16850 [Oxynema aestuarii AP17]
MRGGFAQSPQVIEKSLTSREMVAQVEEVVEQQRQDVTQYSQPVPVQILTGVYLAGVLLPCLVTALTIPRTVVQVGSGVDGAAGDRGDRVRLTSGLRRVVLVIVSCVNWAMDFIYRPYRL